jgi:hypothetical protein
MNSRIGYVAFNTFREAVRDRVLYNLIVFALLISGAAVLVSEISIDVERLVVVNLGLTAVSVFGVLIAIFIGIGLVSKEIEKKTLYTVLSRPVRRWEFVVGKFFGLTGTLVVNTLFMAIGVFLALLYVAHRFEKGDLSVLAALYFIVLEFFVVCALALFFSSFSTPIMSAVFSFAFCRRKHGRRSARTCAGKQWIHWRNGDRSRLSSAEFLRLQHHQSGGARRRRAGNTDSLQHSVRSVLLGHGHCRSGADLSAPEPEMNRARGVNLIATVVLLAAMAGGAATLHAIDRTRMQSEVQDALYIRSAKVLRRLCLGYTGLLADIYWTRAVQYFGTQHHQHSGDFRMLAPLLEVATELDPHMLPPYQFGANFLAQQPPNGAGRPGEALALITYGIEHNPDKWRLYYNLGFLYFTEFKDYARAANAFTAGAKLPETSPFMPVLAARMAQHAGEFDTARMLWNTTYQSTKDPNIRGNAIDHLVALRVDEDVTQLEEVVEKYRRQTKHLPASMADLERAGFIRGTPLDPNNKPYKLMPDGRIEVEDPESIRFITKGLPTRMDSSSPASDPPLQPNP